MLQFIATTNDRYTVPELVQMAIEGGCKWVILRLPDTSDAEIREMAGELVPLCRETATILTIENRPELARELAIHGVHLRGYDRPALTVREELGPEAIIGVEISLPSAALALQRADIDYVTFGPDVTIDDLAGAISEIRGADCKLPIVSEGPYTVDTIGEPLATGANGVAVSATISDAADPVAATEALLRAVKSEE